MSDTSSSLLSYESFETLPLDLAKSIADYLPLEEFRLLHCVSHTLMRIAAVGKPRRSRGSECTPERIIVLLASSQSHLRRHVGSLIVADHFSPVKKHEEKEEEKEMNVLGQEQQEVAASNPLSGSSAVAASGIVIHVEEEKLADMTEEKVADEGDQAWEEEVEVGEEEDDVPEEELHQTITCAHMSGLINVLPLLEQLECHLDLKVDNPGTAFEPISLSPVLTQLVVQLRVVDPVGLSTTLAAEVYDMVERLFEYISCFDKMEYLEIGCEIFQLYKYTSDEQLSNILRPLARLAPSLTSLTITGDLNSGSYANQRIFVREDIEILRKLNKLQQLDITHYWTEQQLEWLLAPASDGSSPFPALTYLGFSETEVTDQVAPLITRISTLEQIQPKSIQTRDCCWLTKMTQIVSIDLASHDTVEVSSLIASLSQMSQLVELSLGHVELTDSDLQSIFAGLVNCVDIILYDLSAMQSLTWFTSLPHLASSCHTLYLSGCSLIPFSELHRLDALKQKNELALNVFKVRGDIKDRTSEEMRQMERDKTEWPQLIAILY